jgi:hypothetical protein
VHVSALWSLNLSAKPDKVLPIVQAHLNFGELFRCAQAPFRARRVYQEAPPASAAQRRASILLRQQAASDRKKPPALNASPKSPQANTSSDAPTTCFPANPNDFPLGRSRVVQLFTLNNLVSRVSPNEPTSTTLPLSLSHCPDFNYVPLMSLTPSSPSDPFDKTRSELEAIQLRLQRSKDRARQLAATAEEQNAHAQAQSTARHEKREDFLKSRTQADDKLKKGIGGTTP